MSNPVIVVALYRPKQGKEKELEALLKRHFVTLKEFGLTTETLPLLGTSEDGSYLEIFEWRSEQAAQKAHDHPAVAQIWEAMSLVSDWGTLSQLPESSRRFPQFQRAF